MYVLIFDVFPVLGYAALLEKLVLYSACSATAVRILRVNWHGLNQHPSITKRKDIMEFFTNNDYAFSTSSDLI